MSKIKIWAVDDEEFTKDALPGMGGRESKLPSASLVLTELDAGELRAGLEAFVSEFSPIAEPKLGAFGIEEIELSLTVNVSGGVALIGKLEAGAEAGIKVTIRRNQSTRL